MASKWTHYFTIAVPAEMQDIANAVAAAMWVDIGDNRSFNSLRATDASAKEWVLCASPCTSEFAASLPYLHSNPEQLHATVELVLARDWPDMQIPTIGDIDGFCMALMMVIDKSYLEALESFGLIG